MRTLPTRLGDATLGMIVALLTIDALVTMKLQSNAGPLYANAGAQIRYRTLLGGSLYVDLARGSAARGALGSGTIPPSRTGTQVELDDLTDVIQGQARTGLQTIPGALAAALSDPSYPARSLQSLAASSPALQGGLAAARGEEPSDIATLIDSAQTTVRALDAPDGELRQLASGSSALLQATGARSDDLQRTIATAPGLLARADRTTTALQSALHVVNPLLVRLQASAPAVAPTAEQLRGTVRPADVLLGHATPLLHALRPAVSSLADAAQPALAVLDQLTPSLTELADRVLPYANEIQPDTKHSLVEMIGPGMAALGAMGAYEDSDGHFARFPATAGSESFYLPCQVDFNPSQTQQLLACESLSEALGALFGGGSSTGASRTAQ
jgi:phospholipid/cholesterol/gamma-HCH transport system substrate-binding protein